MFVAEWRYARSDVHCSAWQAMPDLRSGHTPEEVLTSLCDYLGVSLRRVGFTEHPDEGAIRTDRGYGNYTLFECPGAPTYQYRIVSAGHAIVQELLPE